MFKETRIKNNMKQEELANELGVTQSMISKYEKGIKKPDFETMYKFHKKFGMEELVNEISEEFNKMSQ